ncbi:glycosyltransferase [Roseiconus nitratireducens]|uniref:Glycosyltransferase n=1 Tax=Roseiconus nitratireducens TaxID=2605748 RepID=A0A5M6DFU1_9BACT|nr:glycosyltransferase [Roseiconus nitratireducens]KAA5546273.1 glycosyltransferase [Roseiconus nitratireducens]
MTESLVTEAETRPVTSAESKSTAQRRIVYISWAESCSRSDHTARELGGKSYMVYLGWLGSHPATVPFKYAGQFLMTLWILLRERPRAVFVMSPPLFAALPAVLWKWISGASFALDCHTGAYKNPRWRKFQWLQHWLGRQAATNLVTNEHLAELVESNGGHATIVRDVPVIFDQQIDMQLPKSFNVAVVCSFNYDEPVQEMFEAAALVKDIRFFVTGNPAKLRSHANVSYPANVALTGYLSDTEYGALLKQADAVMTLTTQDHTMLRGAWEAIYQSTPVIVSDWRCLREAFPKGAIFTRNSAAEISDAVRRCQDAQSRLMQEAQHACGERTLRWDRVRHELLQRVGLEVSVEEGAPLVTSSELRL